MTRARLLDAGARRRWTGSRSLALYRCERCGAPLTVRARYAQPALFAHGGYGATESTVERRCECGDVSVVDIATISPRPYR